MFGAAKAKGTSYSFRGDGGDACLFCHTIVYNQVDIEKELPAFIRTIFYGARYRAGYVVLAEFDLEALVMTHIECI